MAWATPDYSREQVNNAGRAFIDPSASVGERESARTIVTNWRSAHGFPLNTFQMGLRRRAARFDNDATVAQRIKRLPSIRLKLGRLGGMDLSRMHDVGGCRAVLASADAVEQLTGYYLGDKRAKHVFVKDYPYIASPAPSGYRSVHLVYRYRSDANPAWNNLRIEIQLRSRPQHAWATAVETVDTFTSQQLKSGQGRKDWLRFFALMSSALARREGTPLVPGTPAAPTDLAVELRKYAKKLDVVERLDAYGKALQFVEQDMESHKGHTFLLVLDIEAHTLHVRSYDNAAFAAAEYGAYERAAESQPKQDVVLVNVDSLDALRRAYPNYFLDTTAFVEYVKEAIE